MREAEAAFGDPTVFIEQAVLRPAPHRGADPRRQPAATSIHLYERDCSVQRRHQKVIEIAPAPQPRPGPARADLRRRGRVRHARSATSTPAPSSSCVDPARQLRLHRDEPAHPGRAHRDRGGHRRRPGAGADAHRRRRDARRPRPDAGRASASAAPRCSAGSRPRTRPTASVPTPGGSRRTARRAARASASTAAPTYAGAEVSPHFDSMLVKLTCRGRDVRGGDRPRPARPGGVPHPRAWPPTSRSCRRSSTIPTSSPATLTTRFIDDAPAAARRPRSSARPRHQAAHLPRRRDRQPAARRPPGSASTRSSKLPAVDLDASRRRPDRASACSSSGPPGSRAGCAPRRRSRSPTRPCATPTSRCWRPGCAPATCCTSPAYVARTTPRAAVARGLGRRDLRRGAALPRRGPVGAARPICARRCPNICLQMLLRGRNTVGYTPYPDRGDARRSSRRRRRPASTSSASSTRSTTSAQMRPAIDAVRATGTARRRGRALLHRRPARPGRATLYTLDYYLRLAEQHRRRGRARAGDQGHGRPAARAGRQDARRRRCASGSTCRSTCTPTTPPGGQLATLLAAIDAGVDAVDARQRADVGHHQPAVAVRAGRRDRLRAERETGLSLQAVCDLEPYWEAVRAPLRAVRVRPARADRPRLPARDPRRPALQPAPAGDRARAGRAVRADRGHVRRRQPHPRATSSRSPRRQQGRRRPRAAPRRRRRRPARLRRRTPASTTSPTP